MGIRIAPKNKNRKGRTDVRKVEKMKRECMELFKNEVVNGIVTLYGDEEIGCIKTLENATIEQIVDEIKIAFENLDYVEYESDFLSGDFYRAIDDDESLYSTIMFYEEINLMKGTEEYNEEDSRTYLYDRITKCVEFIRNNDYIEEMVINHRESFLCEESFNIKIFGVDKYDFSIQVMGNIYDIDNNNLKRDWNEIWTKVYRIVGC